MADYANALGAGGSGANGTGQNAADFRSAQGFRMWTGQATDYSRHPRCAGCNQHAKAGGAHQTIGCLHCTDAGAVNPIDSSHTLSHEFVNRSQNALSLLRWIANGSDPEDPAFALNNNVGGNFAVWQSWEMTSGGAGKVYLRINADLVDPRNLLGIGAFCMPGDTLVISGNTLAAGKIVCKILAVDFSGLSSPNVVLGDQFVLTVTDDCGGVGIKWDPNDSSLATATVYRCHHHPETWMGLAPYEPMFAVKVTKTIEAASFPPDGIFELTGPDDAPCQIAYPLASGEALKASAATLLVETQVGAGDWEITRADAIRGSRLANDNTSSKLYLGTTGAQGQTGWPSLLAGKDRVRLTYYAQVPGPGAYAADIAAKAEALRLAELDVTAAEVSVPFDQQAYNDAVAVRDEAQAAYDAALAAWTNSSTAGAITYHSVRCEQCAPIPSGSNFGAGAGIGSTHYCKARKGVAPSVLALYNDSCWLMGLCPFHKPRGADQVTPAHWAQLWSSVGMFIRQKVANIPDNSNFFIETGGGGGFLFLASDRWNFVTPRANQPYSEYIDLHKYGWFTIETDEDGNQEIAFHTGAIFDDVADKPLAEISDTEKGLFPRRVDSGLAAYSQLEQTPLTGESKPEWWRTLQAQSQILRDPEQYGDGVVMGNGRDRIQRFNRGNQAYIPAIEKATVGTPQGLKGGHQATILAEPVTVGAVECGMKLEIRADGPDFGGKASGKIHALIDDGGGKVTIEIDLAAYRVGKASYFPAEDETGEYWASGNFVSLPDKWRIISNYDQGNARVEHPSCRCVPGDVVTIAHPALEGRKFWVVAVHPSAGSDLTALHTDTITDPRDTPAHGEHLKKADRVQVVDPDGLLLPLAADLAGATISAATDGVIHPDATVTPSFAQWGGAPWNAVDADNMVAWKPEGVIWISTAFLAALPDKFCWKVDVSGRGIANRAYETPAQLPAAALGHLDALDTLYAGSIFGTPWLYTANAATQIGGKGYVMWEDNTYWRENGFPGMQDHYYPVDVDHGLIDSGWPPVNETLLGTADPGKYPAEVIPGEGHFGAGGGGLGMGAWSSAGGGEPGVWCSAALYPVAITPLLKRLPDSATILDARLEIALWDGEILETTEQFYLVLEDIYDFNNEGTMYNNWLCVSDPLFEPTTATLESVSCILTLLGETNRGDWVIVGSVDTGSAMVPGKRVVVPAAGLVSLLVRKKDEYRSFALLVGSDLPTPHLGPAGFSGNKGILSALLGAWEKITVIDKSTPPNPPSDFRNQYGSMDPWGYSSMPPEEAAARLDWMYHLKFSRRSRRYTGSQAIPGNLAIQFQLPDGTIQTRAIQTNWTALD